MQHTNATHPTDELWFKCLRDARRQWAAAGYARVHDEAIAAYVREIHNLAAAHPGFQRAAARRVDELTGGQRLELAS